MDPLHTAPAVMQPAHEPGCWTFRAQDRECIGNRPECDVDVFQTMGSSCHFPATRPVRVVRGPPEMDTAKTIKVQMKRHYDRTRNRRIRELMAAARLKTRSDLGNTSAKGTILAADPQAEHIGHSDADPSTRSQDHDRSISNSGGTDDVVLSSSTPPLLPPPGNLQYSPQVVFLREEDFRNRSKTDNLHLVMTYLDQVFPHLFPHYRPPILEGGRESRDWILDILQRNKVVYRTAVSVASYFSAVLHATDTASAQASCINAAMDQLGDQLGRGLEKLTAEMCALNASKAGFDRKGGLDVMQSLLQMLILKVVSSNRCKDWQTHLDAAIALFEQIVPNPHNWTEMLHSPIYPRWPPRVATARRPPRDTDQAALRFFTATLLYMDVISSVTLGRAPRLARYQEGIMPSCTRQPSDECAPSAGPLSMDAFFGLPNWVLQLLGNIAALDSWKKVQIQRGCLSNKELLVRAKVISDGIQASLDLLEKQKDVPRPAVASSSLPLPVTDPDMVCRPEDEFLFQAMWLLATLSYLHVVTSGWRPASPGIWLSVSKVTHLLSWLRNGPKLRALAWPVCVCGCLCPQNDEPVYRSAVRRLGAVHLFGMMIEVEEVMERVWSLRGQLDKSWDVARCLNVLGHGVLFI
ncbi:hypothetical protein E4U13_001552 [Claviceps humidiphila]|uniref:C6 transcription factor n=1 Tax=Claviceps humidiphila TaxID=1294629 RepID=A0A9P7Q1B0_9HYPO|nr:hypothetical protein E4U13_001552 [Claviceps humidiphila]